MHVGVTGVVAAGQLLAELRESLPPGEYEATVRTELDLSPSDARKYRLIAAHPVLSDRSHCERLPASPSTLYELSQLPDEKLALAISAGEVTARTKRWEASALVERYGDRPYRPPISKPDLGGGVAHPARFSDVVLDVLRELLGPVAPSRALARRRPRVLDPFAGTGRIHELRPDFDTDAVEIEPEWARMSDHTLVGSALDLPFDDGFFDAIATSPCFANRLADAHVAADPHLRRSYTHDLGRPLHPDNAGSLQWGERYRHFHELAWSEADRVLRPGGIFVLNIKDHTRDGVRQPVSSWHARLLIDDFGFELVDCVALDVRHLRQGTNAEARWAELVWSFEKPLA